MIRYKSFYSQNNKVTFKLRKFHQLKKFIFKLRKFLYMKKIGATYKSEEWLMVAKVKMESHFISRNDNSITQMLGRNQFYLTSKNVCHSLNHALLTSFMKTRDLFYQKVAMELRVTPYFLS